MSFFGKALEILVIRREEVAGSVEEKVDLGHRLLTLIESCIGC